MATNIFNPQQGVIVTGSLLGNVDFIDALVQQGSSTRMAEVSPLRYWHDLCYLAWASLNGGNAPQRKAITHIFYHDVQDAEMRRLLTLLVDFRRQRGYDRTWPLPPTVRLFFRFILSHVRFSIMLPLTRFPLLLVARCHDQACRG